MDAGMRTPPLHRGLDAVSGALLLLITVWTPWAFAGTTAWSRWTLCGAGYALGVLLLAKHLVRLRTHFSPPRWVQPTPAGLWAVRALAVLSVVGLEYVLASWSNARASLLMGLRGVDLVYRSRPSVAWLPTTYDAGSTLQALILYGGLVCIFWSARDWLLGRSRHERHDSESVPFPPDRLRWLLWTLCLSSALLALVSMTQRLDGTDRLLWILPTSIPWQLHPRYLNPSAQSWGPFSARAAGIAYFNLVWPVALAFWWSLRATAIRRAGIAHRIGGDASVILLPATLLMAACPWMAGARSGALVSLGQWGICLLVLAIIPRTAGRWNRALTVLGTLALLGVVALMVGGLLQSRFDQHFSDSPDNRAAIRQVTARMSNDAGWLGTGAGSFAGLYSLYRTSPEDRWMGFAHNDWKELRITMGWCGIALAVLVLVLLGAVWRTGRGRRVPREFLLLLAVALGGALIQAGFEFPFQVPAVALVFLLLTAVALATPGIGSRHRDL